MGRIAKKWQNVYWKQRIPMKRNKYQHDTYLSIDSEIQYDKHTTSTWQFLLSTFAFFRKIAHFLLDRVCM
jgi:hypothetical protein